MIRPESVEKPEKPTVVMTFAEKGEGHETEGRGGGGGRKLF